MPMKTNICVEPSSVTTSTWTRLAPVGSGNCDFVIGTGSTGFWVTAIAVETDPVPTTALPGLVTNGQPYFYANANQYIRMSGNPACLFVQGTASAQHSVMMNY